jgi:membrane-associated protease RseP (regulator of RpoE activity)
MAGLLGIFAFVVLMLFAIFFHELGHFVTARWAGIKVSKFFIGFGPTLWSVRRGRPETVTGEDGTIVTRPETEYGVKALPLGGFVKIVGMSPYEDLTPEETPRAFPAAPAWKRAIVLAAGSATHFVTAFLFLILIFSVVGLPNPEKPTLQIEAVQLEIGGEESPAAKAGLDPGDTIVELDGRRVESFQDVRTAIREGDGQTIELLVRKESGATETIELTPATDRVGDEKVHVIGVYPRNEIVRQNPIAAVASSGRAMKEMLFGSTDAQGNRQPGFFQRLPDAFSPKSLGLVEGGDPDERAFSIVGAGKIAGDLASEGELAVFLLLFVQINIFIAIFNMLPLPPLDGGHLVLLGLEKLRRGRPVDPRAVVPVMAVVISILLLLGVFLVYNDVVNPPALPGR